MRFLVTGAGGFIGSHVAESLVERGHEVIALCKYNSRSSFGWLDKYSTNEVQNLNLQLGDVTDTEYIRTLVRKVDIVINLAALIGIPFSYYAPRTYFNVNSVGVLNILESCREFGAKLVQISTSEIYGTPDTVPITLEHKINPQSPYATSKVAADFMCSTYAKSFETRVVIVRPFNTFGPRQSLRAIIPTILSQIAKGTKELRIGTTKTKRDFTFVSDTVRGIVDAAESDYASGDIFQLGTGHSISVLDLVNLCQDYFDVSFEIKVDKSRLRPKESEVLLLESDPSSSRQKLGWNSKISLKEGLEVTYKWLKSNPIYLEKSQSYHV